MEDFSTCLTADKFLFLYLFIASSHWDLVLHTPLWSVLAVPRPSSWIATDINTKGKNKAPCYLIDPYEVNMYKPGWILKNAEQLGDQQSRKLQEKTFIFSWNWLVFSITIWIETNLKLQYHHNFCQHRVSVFAVPYCNVWLILNTFVLFLLSSLEALLLAPKKAYHQVKINLPLLCWFK